MSTIAEHNNNLFSNDIIIYEEGDEDGFNDNFELYFNFEEENQIQPYEKHKFVKTDKLTKDLKGKYEKEKDVLNEKLKILDIQFSEKLKEFKNFEEKYINEKNKLLFHKSNLDKKIKNKLDNIEKSFEMYNYIHDQLSNFEEMCYNNKLILYNKLKQYYGEKYFDFEIKLLPNLNKIFNFILDNYYYEEYKDELRLCLFHKKSSNKKNFIDSIRIMDFSESICVDFYEYIPKNTKTYLNLNYLEDTSIRSYYRYYVILLTDKNVNINIIDENDEITESISFNKCSNHIGFINNNIETDEDICICVYHILTR